MCVAAGETDITAFITAGRRNFGSFIAGYVEPMKARYVAVDSGKDLGECSNLAAMTWGQRASIGGLPHR